MTEEVWLLLPDGGDGLYGRAPPRSFELLLFLWWMMLFYGATDEEVSAVLRARGNRYASRCEPAERPRERPRRSRRR